MNGFYSQGQTNGNQWQDQLSWGGSHNTRYYNMESNLSTTSLFTGSAGVMQDFGWMKRVVSWGPKTTFL